MSGSGVAIHNPDLLSSSEKKVNSGIRSWKNHWFQWARCQKAIRGIRFTKKWRAKTLQTGLEFDSYKPRIKSGIFKSISWLNNSSFGGDDRGFLKEGVKAYLMAPMSLLISPIFCISTLIVYNQPQHASERCYNMVQEMKIVQEYETRGYIVCLAHC